MVKCCLSLCKKLLTSPLDLPTLSLHHSTHSIASLASSHSSLHHSTLTHISPRHHLLLTHLSFTHSVASPLDSLHCFTTCSTYSLLHHLTLTNTSPPHHWLLTLILHHNSYPHHHHYSSSTPMSLGKIVWNNIFSHNLLKRAYAGIQIRDHFKRNLSLEKQGVEKAWVWYVFTFLFLFLQLTTCSLMGWHGQSARGKSGGHLTVRYQKKDSTHITTKHVFKY